jgi:hypothetical protein
MVNPQAKGATDVKVQTKIMLNCFSNISGIANFESALEGTTDNQTLYVEVVERSLIDSSSRQRTGMTSLPVLQPLVLYTCFHMRWEP